MAMAKASARACSHIDVRSVMSPPKNCWNFTPMLPTTERDRTVMPRTTPRVRVTRNPSSEFAVVVRKSGGSRSAIVLSIAKGVAGSGQPHGAHQRAADHVGRPMHAKVHARVETGENDRRDHPVLPSPAEDALKNDADGDEHGNAGDGVAARIRRPAE